jgi:Spy/CpxP family protein refolding chaperone
MGRFLAIAGLSVTVVLWLSPVLPAAEVQSGQAVASQQPASQPAAQGTPGRPSGPPASGSLGPSWDWWDDPAVKKDLKLTDEQARRIRDIFEKREVEVKPMSDQLYREGEKLDKMTRERVADDATYAVQVSKVHHLFAEVRKSRTLMIYRMYRELQPEQYKKLQEIMERRRSMNGRGSGPR